MVAIPALSHLDAYFVGICRDLLQTLESERIFLKKKYVYREIEESSLKQTHFCVSEDG